MWHTDSASGPAVIATRRSVSRAGTRMTVFGQVGWHTSDYLLRGVLTPTLLQPPPLVRGVPLENDFGTLLARMLDEQMSSFELRSTSRSTQPVRSTPLNIDTEFLLYGACSAIVKFRIPINNLN